MTDVKATVSRKPVLSLSPDRRSASAMPRALQDPFLDELCGKSITVFLKSGMRLNGTLLDYDQYALLLKSGETESLVFKHMISTVANTEQTATRPRTTINVGRRGRTF